MATANTLRDQFRASQAEGRALFARRERIYTAGCKLARALAALAHPATSGNLNEVLNWGNAEARAVWANMHSRLNRVLAAFDKRQQDNLKRQQQLLAQLMRH